MNVQLSFVTYYKQNLDSLSDPNCSPIKDGVHFKLKLNNVLEHL